MPSPVTIPQIANTWDYSNIPADAYFEAGSSTQPAGLGSAKLKHYNVTNTFIDARALGLKCDGTTDDATALNAAIVSLAGGCIVFPNNSVTYLNANITMSKFVRLVGPCRADPNVPPLDPANLGKGAVLKFGAAVTVGITINGGALEKLTLIGGSSSGAIGVLVGTGICTGVVLEDLIIDGFIGSSAARGLKVRQAVGTTINRVRIRKCATNLEVSDAGGDGSPTTTWYRDCYFSESTIGPGVLLKGGLQSIFDTCVFESNKQQGMYVTNGAVGDSFGNALLNCWFEDNYIGDLSLTNYHFEQYSPGYACGFLMDNVRFQGGSSARARPMRLWNVRGYILKNIFVPVPLTNNMIKVEEVNSIVRFDGPLFDLAGNVLAYASAVTNPDSATILYNSLLAQNNLSDLASLATAKTNLGITAGQFLATATNDDAAAGRVGEFMEALVFPPSSGVSLTANAPANVAYVDLTPGDWDVEAVGMFTFGVGATADRFEAAVSTTSADFAPFNGLTTLLFTWGNTAVDPSIPTPKIRVKVASGTTRVYLVVRCNFGVSTCKAYGGISARRAR